MVSLSKEFAKELIYRLSLDLIKRWKSLFPAFFLSSLKSILKMILSIRTAQKGKINSNIKKILEIKLSTLTLSYLIKLLFHAS